MMHTDRRSSCCTLYYLDKPPAPKQTNTHTHTSCWFFTKLLSNRLLACHPYECIVNGRAVVLVRILKQAASRQSIDGAFDAAGDLVRFLQLCAGVEVIHAITGVVPSGVATAFLQWGGRYHWIAAIVFNIKQVQRLPSVFITFAAWSLTEVIRYPQYALNMLGVCPWWLTWLRYSVFIPMYPIGALCGEVLLLYQALPYIKQANLYDNIFNKLPFSYYNFVLGGLMLYPFLWLSLYIYMFKQRQSKLGKRSNGKRTSRSKRSD